MKYSFLFTFFIHFLHSSFSIAQGELIKTQIEIPLNIEHFQTDENCSDEGIYQMVTVKLSQEWGILPDKIDTVADHIDLAYNQLFKTHFEKLNLNINDEKNIQATSNYNNKIFRFTQFKNYPRQNYDINMACQDLSKQKPQTNYQLQLFVETESGDYFKTCEETCLQFLQSKTSFTVFRTSVDETKNLKSEMLWMKNIYQMNQVFTREVSPEFCHNKLIPNCGPAWD